MTWAKARPWLVAAVVALPWIVVWPSADALLDPVRGVDAPIDSSLRVPFGAAFLATANADFQTHDRVLDATLVDGDQVLVPSSREALWEALDESPTESVHFHVARGRTTAIAHASRAPLSGWQIISRNWPLIFLGGSFLLFGLTIALGSRHPVAPSLFGVTWCIGANLLAQLDLVLPEDPGVHGVASLRARLGVVSLTLLPAAVIHLAMRFPVVAPRLRSSAIAAVPYVFWLFPAGFAQRHLGDATFLNTLEKVTIGATFVAAGILAIGSLTSIRNMTPIERARTRALLFGLGLGSAVPLVCFVSGDTPPAELRTPLVLSLLAFPAAISWAVVRYRLLDPPAWARSAFLTGLTALVALLGASGLVALALSLIGEPAAALSAEVVPVALTTALLYQLLHLGLRRSAGSRVLRERAFEHFLEAATRELAAARDPNEVLDRIESLVRAHLGASSVQCVTDLAGALDGTPLVRRGLDLWLSEGAPVDRMVRSSTRAEDPGPELPEIVLPLTPPDMPNALVVLSSRSDGLPYDDEHERMLASLRHIATNALQASATTAHLEARVEEKTSSLERALADRQAVLHSARAICEAGDVDAVRETIREFAALRGLSDGNDALAPSRHEELLPQLATLSAFADLAIGRLELLAELKREVERQAQEIAEISSRRLHAEFVRGVAHELRKPTETVRNRVEQLAASLPPELSPTVERIRAASREMSRRLDLLLFHSGLRLDLQRIDLIRIVDDAVEATRASGAVRDVRVHHELPRLRMLADPSRLLSVVENLLDNAVKATEPGQRISVRTSLERNRSHRGNWVRLDVLDEGRGISPEQLDQIFEPGVAFEASGFGLGLSLCREIVRMHGGSIAVESQRGCTVFRIRLPQFRSGEGDDGNGRDSAG